MTYTIQTTDGKDIPLFFGTWSVCRFCQLNGNLSFSAMQSLMADLSYSHIISLILCGAEYHARKNNIDFTYTEMDAAEWIDALGGMMGDKMKELLRTIGKSINPNYQGVEVVNGSEKKSETSAGLSSGLIA